MIRYTGHILCCIRSAMVAGREKSGVTIDNLQQNHALGIHMARVRLAGDPNTYRLILAPDDVPFECGGQSVADYFAKPLGTG